VSRVADEEDGVAGSGVPAHGGVHARDERTDGVDRPQSARGCTIVDGRRHTVGREDEQGAGRRLVLALDEHGATLFELSDDVCVVDDLAADVDRCPVELEGALDGLDGSLDASAVPARRGEKQPRNHGR
jgi:hypothetical protein